MKKLHAGVFRWEISLEVDCPHCSGSFDANSTDDFSEQLRGVQVCEPKRSVEVWCPLCGEGFLFDIGGGT